MHILLWLCAVAVATPPSIDTPVRSGARASQDAAVVVANEDYAFLPDVPFASRDADAVYQTLTYTRGIAPSRIRDLRQVNREQLLSAVTEAAAEVGPDGTLWVYFAGHGAASPTTGEVMLVGDDAKADAQVFEQRSLRVAEIEHAAAGKPVSVLLDTCFAGRGRTGEELVPGVRFAVPTYAVQGAETTRVWTAAGPNEVSGPYEAAQHGLFTYFVVGALRGWADGELSGQPDGQVTLAEADSYVRRALSTLQVRSQRPMLEGAADDDRVLTSGTLEPPPDLASMPRPGGQTASVVPAPPEPALMAEPQAGFVPPLTHIQGAIYRDASGSSVRWPELLRVASQTPEGSAAQQRRGRLLAGQVGTTTAASVLVVTGAVLAAARQGSCHTNGTSFGCNYYYVAGGALAGAGGLFFWETRLAKKRREAREQLELIGGVTAD